MNQFYSNNNRELLATVHKLNCVLGEVNNFSDDDVIMEYVLEKQERNDFHIVRGTGGVSCSTLVCRICGNENLRVGQGAFYTAVKCDNCDYEIGVHEG